jgi:L-aspartate oxidase
MGGVRTDLYGRTSLLGLYAAGEVTCTGVHGANRLASNSLLEGLVFGARAGFAAANDREFTQPNRFESTELAADADRRQSAREGAVDIAFALRRRVRRSMWERVGILRTREGLERALREFEQISKSPLGLASRNFLTVATLIARAALWREESRGAHYRTDFPKTDDVNWRVHSVVREGHDISAADEMDFDAVKS